MKNASLATRVRSNWFPREKIGFIHLKKKKMQYRDYKKGEHFVLHFWIMLVILKYYRTVQGNSGNKMYFEENKYDTQRWREWLPNGSWPWTVFHENEWSNYANLPWKQRSIDCGTQFKLENVFFFPMNRDKATFCPKINVHEHFHCWHFCLPESLNCNTAKCFCNKGRLLQPTWFKRWFFCRFIFRLWFLVSFCDDIVDGGKKIRPNI